VHYVIFLFDVEGVWWIFVEYIKGLDPRQSNSLFAPMAVPESTGA